MSDAKELVIQLPTTRVKDVPQTRSFRWCRALHEALQPLQKYKVQDGSEAVSIVFAAGDRIVAYLDKPFEKTVAWDVAGGNSGFVCRIMLHQEKATYVDVIYFVLEDFLGDASGAREKFARVIAHLEEHAVPQVAPEYITNAIQALEGKEIATRNMKAVLVLHHDDPPCTARLDNGVCSECRFAPDTQSTCLYSYCPSCLIPLKEMRCSGCKQKFDT